jgi:hypothetical protein
MPAHRPARHAYLFNKEGVDNAVNDPQRRHPQGAVRGRMGCGIGLNTDTIYSYHACPSLQPITNVTICLYYIFYRAFRLR